MNNRQIIPLVAVPVIIDLICVLCIGLSSPYTVPSVAQRECTSDTAAYFTIVMGVFKGIYVLTGSYLSFRVRKVSRFSTVCVLGLLLFTLACFSVCHALFSRFVSHRLSPSLSLYQVPSLFNESASTGMCLYGIGTLSVIALALHFGVTGMSVPAQVIGQRLVAF